jgi:hypothetical protein
MFAAAPLPPSLPLTRTRTRTQQNNAGRRGASCAEAEDAYPSDEEGNYVVVAGGADAGADADADAYADDDADEEEAARRPKPYGSLLLRLKTRVPGSSSAAAPSGDCWEPSIPPLPPGWTRSEVPRKTVEGSDVYYRAPCGTLLRSMPEVAKWLARSREAYPDLSIDSFSFLKSAAYGGKQPAGARKPGCVRACVRMRVRMRVQRGAACVCAAARVLTCMRVRVRVRVCILSIASQ